MTKFVIQFPSSSIFVDNCRVIEASRFAVEHGTLMFYKGRQLIKAYSSNVKWLSVDVYENK